MKYQKSDLCELAKLIPSPCNLKWSDLDDTGVQGRKHCVSCDCHVHDVSAMSVEEISSLRQQLGGKLCGMIPRKAIALGSGVAALSLAACSPQVDSSIPPAANTQHADPFPKDSKPVKGESQTKEEPPCLLGIVVMPSELSKEGT